MKNKWKRLTALLLIALCTLSGFAPVQASAVNQSDYSPVFDANYYYNTYEDLQQNIGNDPAALLNHFITIGMKEGRSGNALFNVKAYMNNNLDLLPVYGAKDLSGYYYHYITCGRQEGRSAVFKAGSELPAGTLSTYSTVYDVTEDRAVNVELAASKINGLTIAPGEKFSFSNSIGSRTIANGYVVAPSFRSEEHTSELQSQR